MDVNKSYTTDIIIKNKYCDEFSQEEQAKLSDWYNKKRINFCEKHNEERIKQDKREYKRKMIYLAIGIVVFLCILNCYLYGIQRLFWRFMYFITLRWLLVYIYNIRHKVQDLIEKKPEDDNDIPLECHIDSHSFKIIDYK